MNFPSLDELAERWTIAHTVAVAAWVVVLILGLLLLVRGNRSTYPVTDNLKVYAAENATFKYPANWKINSCGSEKSFIELPGTITSNYKDEDDYQLGIYGAVAYKCVEGRPEKLDLYTERMKASSDPCAPATSTPGEQLKNGLYLQLQEMHDEIYAVHIKQNSCYAPEDTVVIGFAFVDTAAKEGDWDEYGPPRVSKEVLEKSQQYRDIKALAESIRY